ncbi:YkvA family protein [Rhodocaloribacter sp.]
MKTLLSKTDLTPRERTGLRRALRSAGRALQRRTRMSRLIRTGYTKLANNPGALARVKDDLRILLRLARAWVRKEYRAIPWPSILYAVAALIYFVNPADVLPDAFFGLGYVDDVAVITAVARAVRADLETFLAWEAQSRPLPAAGIPAPEAIAVEVPARDRY